MKKCICVKQCYTRGRMWYPNGTYLDGRPRFLEVEDDADVPNHFEEFKKEGGQKKSRSELINEALKQLKFKTDDFWTARGEPQIRVVEDIVSTMIGEKFDTNRAEINKLFPNFDRRSVELMEATEK